MHLYGKAGLVACGTLLGSYGVKVLTSKQAKKVYSHVTAAALRVKDDTMKCVDQVKENCEDILADAKEINEKWDKDCKKEVIEAK